MTGTASSSDRSPSDADLGDDAERLVLADELLAKGDLHGELIIVQCELERGGFSRERGIALRRRELELLLDNADRWANLMGLARNWTFRRGFVDEITIDVGRFVEREEEIWRRAPFLRWLRFTGLPYDSPIDDLDDPAREWDKIQPRLERARASGRVKYLSTEFAQVSWMRDGITRYRVVGQVGRAVVRWLAENESILRRLRGLCVYDADAADYARDERGTLHEIAHLEAARGIEELDVVGRMALGDPRAITLQPRRASLAHLRLTPREERVNITRELLASSMGSRLVELETECFEPDFACNPGLRTLHLSSVVPSSELEAIARAPELAGLEHLAMTGSHASNRSDLALLFAPERLDGLRTLQLGGGVGIEEARLLLASPLAERLEQIDLRHSTLNLAPFAGELRGAWDGHLLL